MKNVLILLLLTLLVSGCSKNNTEKATDFLLENQTNEVTVVVFTNKSLEDSYTETLQKNIDYINEYFAVI